MLDRRTQRAVVAAGAAVAALAGTLAFGAAPASAATGRLAPASCFFVEEYHVTVDGLRIHQYPSTGWAGGVVFGLAYDGQEVLSRRAPLYNAGLWWVYGTDQSTGVSGWMAREYLHDNGDIGTCL